jgi:hypothetical protein
MTLFHTCCLSVTGSASGKFLEVAPVERSRPRFRGRGQLSSEPEAYLYGVSIDTVREVAATGKLCVMGIDEQGVAALQVGEGVGLSGVRQVFNLALRC